MADGRARTSAENGKLGGRPPGQTRTVRERANAIQRRAELSAEVVVEQIARGALFDIRRLFDARGNVIPIHKLSEADAACIAGYEIIIKNAKAGDGQTDEVLKVKLADRSKYVEMAAKYHALLTEKVDVNVSELGSRLDAARLVAAKLRETQPAIEATAVKALEPAKGTE